MWFGHMDGDWSWWAPFGWLAMVTFWGIVVWGIVSLVQRPGRDQVPPRREDDALTILERRYARGELDSQQFENMRRMLKGP